MLLQILQCISRRVQLFPGVVCCKFHKMNEGCIAKQVDTRYYANGNTLTVMLRIISIYWQNSVCQKEMEHDIPYKYRLRRKTINFHELRGFVLYLYVHCRLSIKTPRDHRVFIRTIFQVQWINNTYLYMQILKF